MPSPHPAITPDAIAIAKRYGKNVSRGIVEMEKVIQEQKKEIADMGAIVEEFERESKVE